MSDIKLSKINQVQLREVWLKEDTDFTPWLAKNIDLLSEKLGLDLVVEDTEKDVGRFRADILCRNTSNDDYVLIENQLTSTDHKHLGQLLTYANGLDAVTIIWIAEKFEEEHRATLDWLNKITGDRHRFFGVLIKVVEIGGNYAPSFEVVSKPNNWSKDVVSAMNKMEKELTPRKIKLQKFWEHIKNNINSKENSIIKATRKPDARSYYDFKSGIPGVRYMICFSQTKERLTVEMYITDSEIANDLFHQKDDIESALDTDLVWINTENDKDKRFRVERYGSILDDEENWDQLSEWAIPWLNSFVRVFDPLIKKI